MLFSSPKRESRRSASSESSDHSIHAHPPAPMGHQGFLGRPTSDITVELRGLFHDDRLKVTDVYCPEVRRSPFNSGYHVNHLDVVSCWKGLSISQATEIVLWEHLLREALEIQVLDYLRNIASMSSPCFQSYRGRQSRHVLIKNS